MDEPDQNSFAQLVRKDLKKEDGCISGCLDGCVDSVLIILAAGAILTAVAVKVAGALLR